MTDSTSNAKQATLKQAAPQRETLKQRARHESWRFAVIFAYLWAMFILIQIHENKSSELCLLHNDGIPGRDAWHGHVYLRAHLRQGDPSWRTIFTLRTLGCEPKPLIVPIG